MIGYDSGFGSARSLTPAESASKFHLICHDVLAGPATPPSIGESQVSASSFGMRGGVGAATGNWRSIGAGEARSGNYLPDRFPDGANAAANGKCKEKDAQV